MCTALVRVCTCICVYVEARGQTALGAVPRGPFTLFFVCVTLAQSSALSLLASAAGVLALQMHATTSGFLSFCFL